MEVNNDVGECIAAAHARRELGDEVHEVILECQREGMIRIEEDGTLVLSDYDFERL
jgi:hypothetical protein